MFQYFVTAMIYPCTFLNILSVKIHWERRPAVREHSRRTENTNHGSTSTKDGDSFTFKSTPFTSNSPEILITLRSWPFQTTYCEQKRAITYKIGLHSVINERDIMAIYQNMTWNVPQCAFNSNFNILWQNSSSKSSQLITLLQIMPPTSKYCAALMPKRTVSRNIFFFYKANW